MKKLKNILADILKIDPQAITDKTSPENVKTWDSFEGLMIITKLEKAYHIRFSMEDVMGVKNVGDIKKCLKKYGITLKENR